MHITWDEEAWNDYVWWQFEDRKTPNQHPLTHTQLGRASLIEALVVHAGDYGMSVPEELRPKMKESSAMARALRALDAPAAAAPTHTTTLSTSGIPSGSGHAGVPRPRRAHHPRPPT